MESPERFAYPNAALVADYARAAAGLAFAGAALLVPMYWLLTLASAAAAVVLLAFGVRTAMRQASRIVIDEQAIAVEGPLPRVIPWGGLERLSLRYYATRRDRKHGWMELRLVGAGRRLIIESQIDGFEQIAAAAFRAAAARGLELDASTKANLAAMGL